jgi:hypothetical protein
VSGPRSPGTGRFQVIPGEDRALDTGERLLAAVGAGGAAGLCAPAGLHHCRRLGVALKRLEKSLAYWCQVEGEPRELHPGEIIGAYNWAVTDRVATFTDAEARAATEPPPQEGRCGHFGHQRHPDPEGVAGQGSSARRAAVVLSLPVIVNREVPAYSGLVLDSSAVVSAVGPVNVSTGMSV